MGETTDIGWVRNSDGSKGATVNFWWGCTKVSQACDHCYAEAWAERLKFSGLWGHGKARWNRLEAAAAEAFRLERRAVKRGIRIRVFSNSMADFFDSEVPDAWRDQAMAVIALTPHLDWLVLTKRPKVAREYLTPVRARTLAEAAFEIVVAEQHRDPRSLLGAGLMLTGDIAHLRDWPLPNLWLGVTAENQAMADLRIPELLATPAARRFVSIEPLLGSLDLALIDVGRGQTIDALFCEEHPDDCAGDPFGTNVLDWVIVGGESGAKARPMHPNWVRVLRDQCLAAGVPFFFKQWGEWLPDFEQPAAPIDDDPEQSRFKTCVWNPESKCWDSTNGCWDDAEQWAIATDYTQPEQPMSRVGRKRAGNVLDGWVWDQVPAFAEASADEEASEGGAGEREGISP